MEIIPSAPAALQPVRRSPIANHVPAQPAPSATSPLPGNEPITEPAASFKTPPQNVLNKDNKTNFVKPTRVLSEDVLADRRSTQAREALKQLAPTDQIEQLCNLEAMAQVGAWSKELKPDRVVAYAMADPKLSGSAFVAEGAAIHSERDWYRLQFKCQLAIYKTKVAAFEFLLGDSIPREIWGEHNLPDEDGASD
ncbi:DUF930 domain-containing protein [Agrobacterium vaccinii]|uniref:DUF930 domain-containing protein n=1 Tax=Agrobacterium vaccinii TaxID=2735528 RepID=UPI001E3DE2BA|nr:DUF930 domain-containing protein [Agrobacterium vaccinii]